MQHGLPAVEDAMVAMVTGPTTMKERPLSVALTRSIMSLMSKEAYIASIRVVSGAGDEGRYRWERLPKSVKVLFISGKEDQLAPPAALESISSEVKGSKLVILDAGHSPTIENPEATAKAIIEFLRD
jgi:pimeloyl-ACP methyl ester carboxylesterase